MSDLRIITVGSSQLVADELLDAARHFLGNEAQSGKAFGIKNITDHTIGDLFLCLPTRVEEAAKIIPREKIVSLELVPNPRFYVEVAYIPHNEDVVIFNNNTAQANQIAKYCAEQGINHINFIPVPFNEISEQEAAETLKNAKYILGAERVVNQGSVLQTKFAQYLRPDVKIIMAKRIATAESVCNIIRWITLFNHKKLSVEVMSISNYLSQQLQEITAITNEVSRAIDSSSASINSINESINKEMIRIRETTNTSETLSTATKNIGGIAETIKHISSQTNLLALNAAIEAARVGEHGRGFAVVAQEVRKLAEESRKSTDTIRQSVAEVQSIVVEIVPALASMAAEMEKTQSHIGGIAAASKQENASMAQIAKALENISSSSEKLIASVQRLLN